MASLLKFWNDFSGADVLACCRALLAGRWNAESAPSEESNSTSCLSLAGRAIYVAFYVVLSTAHFFLCSYTQATSPSNKAKDSQHQQAGERTMAAINRPTEATYVVHDKVTVETTGE
jgi:cytochrome c-type biogenesis protein CcmH/NrfG